MVPPFANTDEDAVTVKAAAMIVKRNMAPRMDAQVAALVVNSHARVARQH
jgi:hypothetical protein